MNPRPGRSIPLTTYLGNQIPNAIDVDATPGMVAFARQQHNALINTVGVWEVGPPSGRYNCHGLVFASRRTNIPPAGLASAGLIEMILREDQFYPIPEADAREGDIALWRSERDVEHTGIVCRVERDPFRVVFVWSMWGGLGEFVHNLACTPYNWCQVEFWRMT